MSAVIQAMQQKIEHLLNEIKADQTVERVVIQGLIVTLFGQRPDALQGLRAGVLEGLSRMALNPDDIQGSERTRQLTLMRAEMFFQGLDLGIRADGNKAPSESH